MTSQSASESVTESVTVNDVTLNTRIDGKDGAPWMVLSNSLGSSLAMWDGQMDLLTNKYRVLRYDTRGHGASSVPTGDYTFTQLLGDVLGLMDHYKIDKTAYMGLSMGGMTGMGLAIHHPERFERIICCDAGAQGSEPFRKSWDDRAALIREKGMAALVDSTMERWLTKDCHEQRPADAKKLADMVANTDPNGYIGCAMALKTLDYFKDLGKVTIPMLYVGGEVDSGAMPEVMQAMADATPGATYISIPNAAHIANVDAPDAFNKAISGFLSL